MSSGKEPPPPPSLSISCHSVFPFEHFLTYFPAFAPASLVHRTRMGRKRAKRLPPDAVRRRRATANEKSSLSVDNEPVGDTIRWCARGALTHSPLLFSQHKGAAAVKSAPAIGKNKSGSGAAHGKNPRIVESADQTALLQCIIPHHIEKYKGQVVKN